MSDISSFKDSLSSFELLFNKVNKRYFPTSLYASFNSTHLSNYKPISDAIASSSKIYSTMLKGAFVTPSYLSALDSYNSSISNVLSSLSKVNYSALTSSNKIFDFYSSINFDKYSDLTKINNIQYLSIIYSLNYRFLDNYSKLVDRGFNDSSETLDNPIKPIESIIPQNLGYSFKKDSNISVIDAYDKSDLSELSELSSQIFDKYCLLIDIKNDLFTLCKDSLNLAHFIKDITTNEKDFSFIANVVFKSIYESSGISNNRIYLIAEQYNTSRISDILDLIKYIRNYFDHSQEHLDKKKIKIVHGFIKTSIGSIRPVCKKDWRLLQLCFLRIVDELLGLLIDKLESDSDD